MVSKLLNEAKEIQAQAKKDFTKLRKRDKILMLPKNINKGIQKTMRNKANKLHKNWNNKYEAYRKLCLLGRTSWRVVRMLVPALVGGYLVYTYDDAIIMAIGVAGMLYSIVVIVNSAYLSEARTNTKRK
jgi:hypothetical protein